MKKHQNNNFGKNVLDYILIVVAGILYGISTILFIFPTGLLLGGTSGISVILTAFLPFSPGTIIVILNFLLIVLAFIVLGTKMGLRTFVGATVTTLFIGAFEKLFVFAKDINMSPYLSAIIGAVVIAMASGIMFYVDSSSGGTDIVALIVKKFSNLKIGVALLITDFLIVLVGGILSGITILISSFMGLVIKTLGIDLVISIIKKLKKKDEEKKDNAC